jgi:hypothetical protein
MGFGRGVMGERGRVSRRGWRMGNRRVNRRPGGSSIMETLLLKEIPSRKCSVLPYAQIRSHTAFVRR